MSGLEQGSEDDSDVLAWLVIKRAALLLRQETQKEEEV